MTLITPKSNRIYCILEIYSEPQERLRLPKTFLGMSVNAEENHFVFSTRSFVASRTISIHIDFIMKALLLENLATLEGYLKNQLCNLRCIIDTGESNTELVLYSRARKILRQLNINLVIEHNG